MSVLPLQLAVGMVLGQNNTCFVSEEKSPIFKRGHVARPEDVFILLPTVFSLFREGRGFIKGTQDGLLADNADAYIAANLNKNIFFSSSDSCPFLRSVLANKPIRGRLGAGSCCPIGSRGSIPQNRTPQNRVFVCGEQEETSFTGGFDACPS
ncbi:MAG: hypothetical protein ACNI3A_05215 [Desulfovibrio sp.]|uniref:hypothetical protein n=1 Tax=Desulfovibrio sp. 7SRBS1 TaxID=3378064 RepID=UPI003B404052